MCLLSRNHFRTFFGDLLYSVKEAQNKTKPNENAPKDKHNRNKEYITLRSSSLFFSHYYRDIRTNFFLSADSGGICACVRASVCLCEVMSERIIFLLLCLARQSYLHIPHWAMAVVYIVPLSYCRFFIHKVCGIWIFMRWHPVICIRVGLDKFMAELPQFIWTGRKCSIVSITCECSIWSIFSGNFFKTSRSPVGFCDDLFR